MCSYRLLLGTACASLQLLCSPQTNTFFPEKKFPFAGTLAPTHFHKGCRVHCFYRYGVKFDGFRPAPYLRSYKAKTLPSSIPIIEIIQSEWITQHKMPVVPRSRIFSLGTKLYSTSVRVTVGTCAPCKQRPEVGNGCLPQSPSTIYFETEFLPELGAHWFSWTGQTGRASIFPSAGVLGADHPG